RLPSPTTLLLIEVTHEATLPVFSEQKSGETGSYHNTFRAIPADVTFRPARVTPKPRIIGFVTGIIQAGSEGETGGIARLDTEGRYTVQFHFDTTQHGEEKASHAVRMAQPFAGPNYGMHFPLRRGTEVLLAFADGDPDRPVIVGAVYNASSPSPVVAANAHKHQLKHSSGAVFEFGTRS
ncbi:MAG: type VI secretion system tip protein VgrG, partial [Polyangiaceae bacterium]